MQGFGRRTGPIWVVSSDNGCSDVQSLLVRGSNHSRAQKVYTKLMRVYYVNDKGSSVAVKCGY